MTSGSGGKKLQSFWTCRNSPEKVKTRISSLMNVWLSNNKEASERIKIENDIIFKIGSREKAHDV